MTQTLNKAFSGEAVAQLGGTPWLAEYRRTALELFHTLNFPTTAVEAWKYTDVSELDFDSVRPAARKAAVSSAGELPQSVRTRLQNTDVAGYLVFDGPDVVFRDVPQELAAKGVIFTDLRSALDSHAELVQQYLYSVVPAQVPDDTTIAAPGTTPSKSPDPSEGKFSALNAALWTNGAFVYVPRGVEVELPLGAFQVLDEAGIV